MADTAAERQARWRDRHILRSDFFLHMNQVRQDALRAQFSQVSGPFEPIRLLRDFFLAYPRCFNAPISVEVSGPDVRVSFLAIVGWEVEAAKLALGPHFERVKVDAALHPEDEISAKELREEISVMKRLGIWGV